MPRIQLVDGLSMMYQIDTRNPRTLQAWFAEVLPLVNPPDAPPGWGPGRINVFPMFGPGLGDADWPSDSRVLGRVEPFPALTGAAGMYELDQLRKRYERELAELRKLGE